MVLLRKLSVAISSPGFQYLIGILINFSYILILINNSTSYQNLQVPEGIYSENLWQGSDVLSYVQPARNFIEYGIFGYGTMPDYHRTIGYPLFLSTLMRLFGSYWFIFTLFIQASIFALIYPLLSEISSTLFSSGKKAIIISFLLLIFLRTYIVRVPQMLTDTFFTVFFMLGLWSGVKSIIEKSYKYLLLHILFMGYAAQVRPVLFLYPIVNCLVLIYI